MNTTLFKMDANGCIRVWTAWVEHYAHSSTVFARHGLNGATPTISRSEFVTWEHEKLSDNELASRLTYMQKRRGYTETIPVCKPFRPMLLQSYKNRLQHIPPEVYIQPKLNGHRCLASSQWMKSREGNTIASLPEIQAALADLPEEIVLDGELYSHGFTSEQTQSVINRNTPDPERHKMSFVVYDLVDESLTFTERWKALQEIFQTAFMPFCKPVLPHDLPKLPHDPPTTSLPPPPYLPTSHSQVVLLDTLRIDSSQVDEHFKFFLSHQYEGAVIRLPNSHYQINVRSPGVLKLKPFETINSTILDIVPCDRAPTQGKLVLQNPKGGTFVAQLKGNHHYRTHVLRERDKYLGCLCTVEFEDYSENDKPLKPVGIKIHE